MSHRVPKKKFLSRHLFEGHDAGATIGWDGDRVEVADGLAIDPQWFGAIPDDAAAASANASAIQQAFDLALGIKAGELRFGPGDYYTDSLDFTALNLQPLRFIGSRGGGQHSVVPGTRLIYTGTGSGRFINARGNRSLEFIDIGIHHNNSGFTGTLLDLSGMALSLGDPRGADGTRHLLRRVLLGSTDAATIQTALGVDLDGTHSIQIEDLGLVGLANGIRGMDVTRKGYANNINIRGGYGAGISGHHVLNLGKSWAIRDYTAEPRTGGIPNLVFATIQGGVPPNLVLDSCECDDGTAFGFWVEMESGTCIIIGGDYRIDGGGAAFHALGPMDAVYIYSPRVAAGSPAGNSIIDGGSFVHKRVDVLVPGVGVNIDTPIRNLPPVPGFRDVGAAQIQTTGTAAPITDTWPQGSIVWNTTPTAGGNAGWICVTAGTPGTWRTFGTIAV